MTTVLRPGILVALKTSVRGGVQYTRRDIEDREDRARWETTRTIDDPAEHKRATEARSKARSVISSACACTSFGLLCPEASERVLDAAITESERIVREFNATSSFTKVEVFALKGRVAATDDQAARAIAAEVSDLLAEMRSATEALDPKAMRAAATQARSLSAMLAEDKAKLVSDAVAEVRKNARIIVKSAKEGTAAAAEALTLEHRNINAARFAFVDTSEPTETPAPAAGPSVNLQRFGSSDEMDDDEPTTTAPSNDSDQGSLKLSASGM